MKTLNYDKGYSPVKDRQNFRNKRSNIADHYNDASSTISRGAGISNAELEK